jgi:hypothetical protein
MSGPNGNVDARLAYEPDYGWFGKGGTDGTCPAFTLQQHASLAHNHVLNNLSWRMKHSTHHSAVTEV